MDKSKLGTKRVCPETSKKFYDLNKDPIVSPYSGKSYPVSFFEEKEIVKPKKEPEAEKAEPAKKEAAAEEEEEVLDVDGPEIISLDDAEDDVNVDDEDEDEDDTEVIPDIPDVEIEIDDDEDADKDVFLEDEDDDDDLSDVIGDVEDEKEV